MKEKTIQDAIRLAVQKRFPKIRLFRNNVGQGFVGKAVEDVPKMPQIIVALLSKFKINFANFVLLINYRRIRFGLIVGSGDLIGYEEVIVTQEMVGKPVAIFLSVETKQEKGTASEEQENWREQVNKAGGIAIIARSASEALEVLGEPR